MSSKITIVNSEYEELATIDSVLDCVVSEKLNSEKVLNFELVLDDLTTQLINDTNIVKLGGDYYDIAAYKKEQQSKGELRISVECEHISYRLNNPEYNVEYFTEIGTPSEVLTKILQGTDFTAGTLEFMDTITFSAQEAMSRRGLLMAFVDYLGGEVDFQGFNISILQHRGSNTPKNLTSGRNITVVSKQVSKRDRDNLGNPLIVYECELVNPETIDLGDVITMEYDKLDIDITLRVISISKNPYNPRETVFEIGNFVPGLEDDIYKIQTSTVMKGNTYYGARISPENGFESVRSDKRARGIFNADTLAMQSGDGTGENWQNRLYYEYDSEADETVLVFDGKLSASAIAALEAVFDVTISNTVIVQNLYTSYGRIADLSVSELDTSWKKITNFLANDTSDVNYIHAYGQYLEFKTAITDGTLTEQLTDKDNNNLYWVDATHQGMTTNPTDYPVLIFVYDEHTKFEATFEETGNKEVRLTLGRGFGYTNPDAGKAFIYKDADGLLLKYVKADESVLEVRLGEDGIVQNGNEGAVGLRNIAVSSTEPTSPQNNDLWIDLDSTAFIRAAGEQNIRMQIYGSNLELFLGDDPDPTWLIPLTPAT